MSKYLKYTLSIFVMALTLSAIHSTSGNAELFCFCVGNRSNGFNITAPQRNGRCFRSQTGPICVSQEGPTGPPGIGSPGPPGPVTCPSIIGGQGTGNSVQDQFLPYFFVGGLQAVERTTQQSVETDGSLSGLNVLIQDPANNPSNSSSWIIHVRVNGGDTIDLRDPGC